MESHVQFTQTGPSWTNEKHMHFLNSMEASFVRSMFQNRAHRRRLRLDRLLPDTADSTLDSPLNHTKNHPTSGQFNLTFTFLIFILENAIFIHSFIHSFIIIVIILTKKDQPNTVYIIR